MLCAVCAVGTQDVNHMIVCLANSSCKTTASLVLRPVPNRMYGQPCAIVGSASRQTEHGRSRSGSRSHQMLLDPHHLAQICCMGFACRPLADGCHALPGSLCSTLQRAAISLITASTSPRLPLLLQQHDSL